MKKVKSAGIFSVPPNLGDRVKYVSPVDYGGDVNIYFDSGIRSTIYTGGKEGQILVKLAKKILKP